MAPSLKHRKENTGQVNGTGHGNAGKEGTHHHQFCGKVFAVVEFHGVKYGIHCRRNRGHNEYGLTHGRCKGYTHDAPGLNQQERQHRRHHQTDKAAQPGIHITEGNLTSMNLHAQGDHDDSHQGGGTVLENRPEEGGGHIKAGILDSKHRRQGIEHRHVEDHGQGIPGCQFPFSCLVEAKGIETHIHLYQHHGSRRTGQGQVGRFPVHHIGGIGKYQGNQGNPYISVIGKHGPVFEGLGFGNGISPDFPNGHAYESQDKHECKGQQKYVEHGHIDLCHINAVENKTGKNHIKGQFRQGRYVQPKAPVHTISDSHENQKRQDIIRNNL